jgi:tetratricopeptide (TPR) repeat protein
MARTRRSATPLTLRRGFFLALLLTATAAPLAAQEFTQQTLLVAPLHGDQRLARKFAVALRTRIAKLSNKRELYVLDGDTTENVLEFAGYQPDTVIDGSALRDLAHLLRADEVVVGTVRATRAGPVEVTAVLTLVRDLRLRQPLAHVKAATLPAAADSLALEIVRARSQLVGLRRCENAARESQGARAVEEARRAVAGYPRSTLARTCLATELAATGASADTVARISAEVLAVDSLNIVAAVLHAEALVALKRSHDAAVDWGRVVALRPDSLELGLTSVEWILQLHEPALALSAARRLLAQANGDLRVRRLIFRAYSAQPDYAQAAALGDSLDAEDTDFRDDSILAASHVVALRAVGDTLGAIVRVARAVKRHPGDPILYIEYLQLVAGENSTAFHRGLERFPDMPDFRVLAATQARATGNAASELASLREAVRLDSAMTRGYLRIAELWFAQRQPDSAVATLARAPRSGDSADLLRSYSVGRAMQVLRAAAPTVETFHTTIALFAIADSVESKDDTRSLLAAVTMQLAQRELENASTTHDCAGTREAAKVLVWADAALRGGVGEGSSADELKDAYAKLSTAAGAMSKSLCGAWDRLGAP